MSLAVTVHFVAWSSIGLGIACALLIATDVVRHPQPMAVMNLVWPLTALFGGPLLLLFYLQRGRPASNDARAPPAMAVATAKGALHCGAGCAVADIVGEVAVAAAPGLAVAFGWTWLFSERTFAVWVLDYLLALAFGIGFQYFAIAPIRHLGLVRGFVEAAKADVLSLSAWQFGMYGLMALGLFWLFPQFLGIRPGPARPEFWFLMQWAMIAGLVTSYPVNWMLIRFGVKEAM